MIDQSGEKTARFSLSRIPLPFAAIPLSFFALGNLFQDRSIVLRHCLAIIAIISFLLLTLRIFNNFKKIIEEMKNPVIASVFPCYAMATILMAQYIAIFNQRVALPFWFAGIILHAYLLISFSIKFIIKDFKLKAVFPSWFIVYVGMATASVSAPALKMQKVGQVIFYFTLIAYIPILLTVIRRSFKEKEISDIEKPLFTVYAAPASLLTAGYLSSFAEKSNLLVSILFALSFIFYFIALYVLLKNIKLPFYPSFSAFTFPLVISAIAGKMANAYFRKSAVLFNFKYFVNFQELLALIVVLFVFIKYIQFIFKPQTASEKKQVI